jgi:hypothetical protein
MNIIAAMHDNAVFGSHFRDKESWAAWRTFLATLFALPLSAEQLKIYRQCTGRAEPPLAPAQEGWLVCGRRAGKSFVLAVVAIFLACFRDWRRYLGPGERCTVMIVAADRRQARVIMRYCRGLLKAVPMLEQVIEGETRESLDLRGNVTIEVHTASFRSTRGYAICAALLDELAFWHGEESTDPDTEVIAAIRPAMATIPGAMLLCASSPYARRGALWEAHRKHFGKDGDPVLVWQAPTRLMNPSVPQHVIDEATERDSAHAAAEYLAEFRTDVESFVPREVVEACITPGVYERAPLSGVDYQAFVDPAGGSGTDSMTMAIGHSENDMAIIDALRERKPRFSPEDVVEEFAPLLKSYRISKVVGDRFAGEWPRERFGKHGITYEPSATPKSDLYRDLLPVLNSKKIDLLDNDRLVAQLVGLERKTARGGKDSIDHAQVQGAHDDVVNSVAGVCALVANKSGYDSSLAWVGGPGIDNEPSQPRQRSIFEHPCFGLRYW